MRVGCKPHKGEFATHKSTTLSEALMCVCVAFQILGVPQNRKGPRKGHWGQHRFLIHISPPRQSSPLDFLSLFLLAVQLHLLQQEPSYLIHSSPSLLASKFSLTVFYSI